MNRNLKISSLVLFAGLASPMAFAEHKPGHAKKAAKGASEVYTLDTGASYLGWEGTKVTGKHDGRVSLKGGTVELKDNAVVGGAFDIDMTSIKVEDIKDAETNAKLVGHLKSDDFFSVEKNPTASFKIKSVHPKKSDGGTHEITGDLTIKGHTNQLVFPATITVQDGTVEAVGKASVDRTKYEVRYGSGKFFKGLGDKVIHDNFTVEMHLSAKK